MLDEIFHFIIGALIPDGYGWRFWLVVIIAIILCGLILLTALPQDLKIALNLILIITSIIFARKWDQTIR